MQSRRLAKASITLSCLVLSSHAISSQKLSRKRLNIDTKTLQPNSRDLQLVLIRSQLKDGRDR